MTKRIALISEHASPLAVLGGVDGGGQNVYVGQIARNLADLGYEVDVFTRRDNPRLPKVVEWTRGVRILHVPAGPPVTVPLCRSPSISSADCAKSREYVSSRRRRRVSARNQSMATVRAMRQSQVRGEPRLGSKRLQVRNAFSNVSAARSSAAERSPVKKTR